MREIEGYLNGHLSSPREVNFTESWKLSLPMIDEYIDFSQLPQPDKEGKSTILLGRVNNLIGLRLTLNFEAEGIITDPDLPIIRTPFTNLTINNSFSGVAVRGDNYIEQAVLSQNESEIILSSLCSFLSSVKSND